MVGIVAAFGVAALGERAFGGRGRTGCHRDFRAAHFGKETINKLCASLGVSKRGGDAEDLQFRAAQSQSEGESVIEVVADVGVDDDFGSGGGCVGLREQ